MEKKIFITGMGAVTPIGVGVNEFIKGLEEGRCAISEIETVDTSDLKVKEAAQVKGFDAKQHLPSRLAQDLEPYMQYAFVSAQEALEMSGIRPGENVRPERIGIVMGTALHGINIAGVTQEKMTASGRSAGPKFLVKYMGNIAAAQFAINSGIKGPSLTVSTACSSGGDAIGTAAGLIALGAADVMVVMAGEAAINRMNIQSLVKMGALSKTGQSLPFDKNRNGFVLGEGGGAVILENEGSVKGRGAAPLAELLGCGNNTDGFNPVSPHPEGEGAAACIKLALDAAGISPDDVDYINAHGTATPAGDIAEVHAIHSVFGERPVFVSSTKGMTGHMMGAGGITEVIACVNAVRTGHMPVNVGCTERDENCDLNLVTNENCCADVRIALSNAMGFGGQNSCIIVGRA